MSLGRAPIAASPWCPGLFRSPTKCRLNYWVSIFAFRRTAPSSPFETLLAPAFASAGQSQASCSTPGQQLHGRAEIAELAPWCGSVPRNQDLSSDRGTQHNADRGSFNHWQNEATSASINFRVFLMTNPASIFELSTDCLPHNERI